MTGYRMPAEWAPQERIWMAFPCEGYTLGGCISDGTHKGLLWWRQGSVGPFHLGGFAHCPGKA